MCNGSLAYSTLAGLCYARIDSNEVKYWVGFSRIPTIDRVRISLMEGYLGSLEKAWHPDQVTLRPSVWASAR